MKDFGYNTRFIFKKKPITPSHKKKLEKSSNTKPEHEI